MTDPAPAKLPMVFDNEDVSWNPAIVVVESTFGLKSNTFFRFTIPYTAELNDGIRSSVTPASCK